MSIMEGGKEDPVQKISMERIVWDLCASTTEYRYTDIQIEGGWEKAIE